MPHRESSLGQRLRPSGPVSLVRLMSIDRMDLLEPCERMTIPFDLALPLQALSAVRSIGQS